MGKSYCNLTVGQMEQIGPFVSFCRMLPEGTIKERKHVAQYLSGRAVASSHF